MTGFLAGYKTYLAAAGLVGLGLYQVTSGDVPGGLQSLLAALGAAGLRGAVAKVSVPVVLRSWKTAAESRGPN